MPRTTKETKNDELETVKKVAKSSTSAKKTTGKKSSTKKEPSTETKKKTTSKKNTSSTTKKTSAKKVATKKEGSANSKNSTKKLSKKEETKTSKSTSSKKVSTKKADTPKESKTKTTAKKTTSKKSTSTKKSASKTTTSRKKTTSSKVKKLESNIIAEYYDLPYRYNETLVKILYQTPNVLFVYWDISDNDRNNFTNQYGENFFNKTKPILRIFNLTKNYNFEVEINDFANSWYINVNDANCNYKVELGRKPISYDSNINTDYIYVSSSNDIEFPNDHILLEELPSIINFKNVKTNKISTRNINTLRIVGIKKIYSVYDFYKKLYNDNILDELNNKKILNPSSTSSWSN